MGETHETHDPDVRTCPGCGAQTAMWACEGCGAASSRSAIDAFGELGHRMEAVAAEGAQQPNRTFEAIAGGSPRVCAGTCTGAHEPGCAAGAGPFAAAPAGFAMQGRWRVYFNKHGRADLPWCIAPAAGGWEIAVPAVLITTEAETVYQPKATPDDEDGRPSAWLFVEGKLVVALGAGRATISATSTPEVQTP